MTVQKKTTRQGGLGEQPSDAKLGWMFEEAIMDAHDESEQTDGFYTMLENSLVTSLNSAKLQPTCQADKFAGVV